MNLPPMSQIRPQKSTIETRLQKGSAILETLLVGAESAGSFWRKRPKAGVRRLTVMRVLPLAFGVVLTVAASAPAAFAQDASSQPQTDPTVRPEAQVVNPDELGVSIDRIRLRFRRNSLFQNVFDPSKLRITAYVDVVGRAPAIRLFGSDPRTVKEQLTSRAVPFGAPTHQDILQMWTPPEFRTPPMDLTAIVNWLAQQLQKKDEK